MNICQGNSKDHCCYLPNIGVCQYLEENTMKSRRWVCKLRRELGTWNKVHADPRYIKSILPNLSLFDPNLNCGDWPRLGETCNECGARG